MIRAVLIVDTCDSIANIWQQSQPLSYNIFSHLYCSSQQHVNRALSLAYDTIKKKFSHHFLLCMYVFVESFSYLLFHCEHAQGNACTLHSRKKHKSKCQPKIPGQSKCRVNDFFEGINSWKHRCRPSTLHSIRIFILIAHCSLFIYFICTPKNTVCMNNVHLNSSGGKRIMEIRNLSVAEYRAKNNYAKRCGDIIIRQSDAY